MKKILVIGSTVVDVIIRLDHLPRTAEDVNVEGQQMSMGGCAYNAAMLLRHMGVPHCLFSPVGTGAYGDFVREHFQRRNMEVLLPVKEENVYTQPLVKEELERDPVQIPDFELSRSTRTRVYRPVVDYEQEADYVPDARFLDDEEESRPAVDVVSYPEPEHSIEPEHAAFEEAHAPCAAASRFAEVERCDGQRGQDYYHFCSAKRG